MWRNTAGVPALSSFAEYKRWYDMTKPIRGNKDKVRPLGHRRHHRMASFDMPDADTIVLKYYNDPVVVWKSDDSFTVLNNVYQSPWSAAHLVFFLPKRWEFKWNGCRMTIGKGDKFYLMPKGTQFNFVKAGDDYELVNKPVAYAIRKKRGSDAKILEKCEPFFDWLTVVTAVNNSLTHEETKDAHNALREEVGVRSSDWYRQRLQAMHNDKSLTAQEREKFYDDYRMSEVLPSSTKHTWVSYRSFHTPSCERLMQWVEGDNAEKWVLAMNILAERAGRRRYRDGSIQFELTADDAAKFLLEIARHVHRDSIFYKEQLADGVVPSRSNAVYMCSHAFSL